MLLIDTLWSVYDTNENGYLDREEMELFLDDLYSKEGVNKRKIKKLFNLIDKNDDGVIDKGEVLSVLYYKGKKSKNGP